MKRYNLVLPEELYSELEKVADDKGVPVVELLRKFIKLGLLALDAEKDGGGVIIFANGKEKQVIM
jgi:hypothetical protein